MSVALDRDALYYPYIHVRDANWLKATLLSFPQVRRIVPKDFALNDPETVKAFRSVKGARGEPLLAEEPAYPYAVYKAQLRLQRRLEEASPEILGRYTRRRTMQEYPDDPNAFEMHEGKMQPLLDFLGKRNLVWPTRREYRPRAQGWYAVHPKLGEVLMSIVAIAIATEKQLNIVTNSGRVHRALAGLDENALLAGFLEETTPMSGATGSSSRMADELCQIVMLTSFDLSRLTANQIAELQKDGQDLRRFKNELLKITNTIPDIPDPEERDRRLKAAAEEVRVHWDKYRRSLPRFALDAMISAADWKAPEFLASVTAGASSATVLAAGGGLLIGLAAYAGLGIWQGYKEKASSPYQFLSQIQAAGASLSPRPVTTATKGDAVRDSRRKARRPPTRTTPRARRRRA